MYSSLEQFDKNKPIVPNPESPINFSECFQIFKLMLHFHFPQFHNELESIGMRFCVSRKNAKYFFNWNTILLLLSDIYRWSINTFFFIIIYLWLHLHFFDEGGYMWNYIVEIFKAKIGIMLLENLNLTYEE